MKYKHAFWLSLPLTVLGLGKAIHKFKAYHCGGEAGHCHGSHGHFLKLIAWRLGLSAEQKSKLHSLTKQTHEKLEGLAGKKQQLQMFLQKGFSEENFDVSGIRELFTGDDFERIGSTISTVIGEFHALLTPLQRETVAHHLQKHHAHCFHGC